MVKEIKVEWCENFIRAQFKKHSCKGIEANLMCDMVFPVMAPDGGIWSDHEAAEYSGVIHTTRKDAEDEMKQAIEENKNNYSVGSFWITEMEN